jgi:hypothetical protein
LHKLEKEIIQKPEELDRLCGQRGKYESKRANKCPLIFLGIIKKH